MNRTLLALIILLAFAAIPAQSKVVISEIMYNPSSLNPQEEYLELFNHGIEAVNLENWQLHSAIQFTFPSLVLLPGQYLVVAAYLPTFRQRYPFVLNVVGGWTGSLGNTDEDIDLDDASSRREDSVHYASEGDWAVRGRGPLHHNHRGWIWIADHDGQGKSLELINPELSNNYGQNWGASRPIGGTLGRANSIAQANIAPLILQTTHFPTVPKSTDRVVVTAELLDEQPIGARAILHYRLDGQDNFKTISMADDGAHEDGGPNDGFFGASLPPQANSSVVEFYIEAVDGQGNTRTWPAPASTGTQVANLLYQVRDLNYNDPQPLYLLIMRDAERDELAALGGTLPDAHSDAQMNGTFISIDGQGTTVRYNVGIRNRGHGTRTAIPNNYHISFPNDRRWQGRRGLSLNSQYPHSQVLGSVLFDKVGLAPLTAWAAQVRVNNANLAKPGIPQFGSYAAVEVLNSDYVSEHFPDDPQGNAYRGVATDPPAEVEADLFYRGPTPGPYRKNYLKETNVPADDWSDLIELTRVLSETSANSLPTAVSRVLDVDEWLRYFAMNAILENNETGIYMGYGDDYALYRGIEDPRFKLLPYDLDTLMGQGAEPGTNNASIFRATALFVLKRFLRNPAIEPLYYSELRHLIQTVFSAAQLNPLIDEVLGGWVPESTRNQMKNFAAARNKHILDLLPHLVSFSSSWKYRQPGSEPGADWRDPGLNETGWLSGSGLFYKDSRVLPGPKGTQLKLGKSAYYFRRHFPVSASLLSGSSGVNLTISTVIDDGAVFYLNGQEIFRLGMPGGPIGYGTEASRLVGLARVEGPFVIPGDNLVAGDNVLAVEVHQTDPSSSDVVFGLTLDLTAVRRTGEPDVLLNEISANRSRMHPPGAPITDWLELANRSNNEIDLTDASLTDADQEPRKWVFPSGTILPARGYLVIACDGDSPASGFNTGFSLKAAGDQVYFFEKPAKGGALLDSVSFGLQPSGYSIGRVAEGSETVWVLTGHTPGKANVPAAMGKVSTLKINEWLADPHDGASWFELYNPDPKPVRLSGLYLSDNPAARKQFRIPVLSFMGAGSSGYQKFEADGNSGQGADHVNFKLNKGGEAIGIFSDEGNVLNQVKFGPQISDISEGRFPDGSEAILAFPQTATPGHSNFLPLTNAVFNELLTHATFPLEHAIELANTTSRDLNIGGWYLSDDPDFLTKFRIPLGTVLPAGGLRVFYAYQFAPNPNSPQSIFVRPEQGGEIYLSAVDISGALTGYRAHQKFGPAENGVSLGRVPTSAGFDFFPLKHRSFGADAPATLEQFRSGAGLPNSLPQVGPVVISEVMYLPQLPVGTNLVEDTNLEFVELSNLGAAPVPLYDPDFITNTWAFLQGIEFQFPPGLTISPGGSLLIVGFDPAIDLGALSAFRDYYRPPEDILILGPYAGKLANTGEMLELFRPARPGLPLNTGLEVTWLIVDRIHYQNSAPWPVTVGIPSKSLNKLSLISHGNDPAHWASVSPTPGRVAVPINLLRFSNVSVRDSAIVLGFQAEPATKYSIESRDSFSVGAWTSLTEVPAQANRHLAEVTDRLPAGTAARFYRVRTLGP